MTHIQMLTSTAFALTLALAGAAHASTGECPKKGGAECIVLIGVEAMAQCSSSATLVCEAMKGSQDYAGCIETQKVSCEAKASIEEVMFCEGIFIKDDTCFGQGQQG